MLKKRNQKGFTLIEIIAVLVILGILAAVAIPKYFDMQAEAKNKATQGALGNAGGEISLRYANMLLAGSGAAVTMGSLATQLNSASKTLGDYVFTYAANGGANGIDYTVLSVNGGAAGLGTPTSKTTLLQ